MYFELTKNFELVSDGRLGGNSHLAGVVARVLSQDLLDPEGTGVHPLEALVLGRPDLVGEQNRLVLHPDERSVFCEI